jgi:hypothetical protein
MNLDSLDPVRSHLVSQLTAAPTELETCDIENTGDILFLVTLADDSIATATWSDPPSVDLHVVGTMLLQYLEFHWRKSVAASGENRAVRH